MPVLSGPVVSAGRLVKMTSFAVLAPRLVPLKFTVAVVVLRAREAAVKVDVSDPPVPTVVLIVEWPPASVIVPTVSLEAVETVLLPRKASVASSSVMDAPFSRFAM